VTAEPLQAIATSEPEKPRICINYRAASTYLPSAVVVDLMKYGRVQWTPSVHLSTAPLSVKVDLMVVAPVAAG